MALRARLPVDVGRARAVAAALALVLAATMLGALWPAAAAADLGTAAVLNSSNDQQAVYYVGADGQIHTWYYDGTWSNGALGSGAPAATGAHPVDVIDPSTQRQWLYYAGADGQIYTWYFDASAWSNAPLGNGEPAAADTSPRTDESSGPATGS